MWWLCLLNDDIHKRMTNIQHTEWEKHMVMISTVKPPIGFLNDAFRKCFYNGLHMTLECTNTKQFGLFLSGCITMSLPWRTEPTETLAHQSRKQAEFCKVLNPKKIRRRNFQTEKPKKIPNRPTKQKTKSRKTKRLIYLGISTLGEAKLVNESIHFVHFLFERRVASKA